jgi:hypothetical protein
VKNVLSRIQPELLAFLVLLTFQCYLISSSNGFYYIDEGAHFVDDYAALRDPAVSLGVWQRFGSVWFFTLPAQFGHKAVKVFASLTFLLIIYLTYKVAEIEEMPYREWIVVLAGFQPVFLDISFTCLAELPATLFLILAYYLYKKSSWKLSLAVASLVFTCRYEMSILAVFIFFAALHKRKYSALPFALVGPVLWYAGSLIATGDPAWLFREFIKFGSIPKFIPGTTLFHYFTHATDIYGIVQVCLAVIALLFAAYQRKLKSIIPLLTILWCIGFNTAASAGMFHWSPAVGDFRYLATVGPFVALFSVEGLSRIMTLLRKVPFAGVFPTILALLMIYPTIMAVHPHDISPYEQAVIAATKEAAADSSNIPILSNHWASRFALLHNRTESKRLEFLNKYNYLKNAEEYVVWDSEIANSIFSQQALTLKDVEKDPAVKLIDTTDLGYASVRLFLRDARATTKAAAQ